MHFSTFYDKKYLRIRLIQVKTDEKECTKVHNIAKKVIKARKNPTNAFKCDNAFVVNSKRCVVFSILFRLI